MKMNKLGKLALVVSLGLGLTVKAEESKGFYIGGSATIANDSLRKVTNETLGLNLNIGLDRMIGDTNIGLRPQFAMTWLSGKPKDGTKTSLVNLQVAADVLIPVGYERVRLVTGFSINQWRYAAVADSNGNHPFNLSGKKAPASLKLGFRGGVDVKIADRWTAEALFQMVEFGSMDTKVGYHNFNPSWIQVGVKYHF